MSGRRLLAAATCAGLLASPGLRSQAPAFNVFEKSITELQNAMAAGTITSRQIVEQYRARIEAYDQRGPMINAFISLNSKALDEAAALDAERKAGRTRGPLHGIPVAIKDNYVTADLPTTGGSLALEGFAAGRDAFAVRKLRQQNDVPERKPVKGEKVHVTLRFSRSGPVEVSMPVEATNFVPKK